MTTANDVRLSDVLAELPAKVKLTRSQRHLSLRAAGAQIGMAGGGLADFVLDDDEGEWVIVCDDPMDDPTSAYIAEVLVVQGALSDVGFESNVTTADGSEPCSSMYVGGDIWLDVTVQARRV